MRFPLPAERVYTCLATGVEPTKLMARTSGWSHRAFTTSFPPFTIFTTPLGNPVFSSSSMARCMVSGTRSEGFKTNVLPHAMAYGRNQNEIIGGGLHRGVNIADGRNRRPRQHFHGRGIGDIDKFRGAGPPPLPVHIILQ